MGRYGTERVWKVGELAAEAGLTVRTLHHYDRIGLVCPAERTGTGHRLYTAGDVERLYQVLALRQLGLGLDRIADLLAGTVDMAQVLSAHRDYLAAQLAATRDLFALVTSLAATAEDRPDTSSDRFLELIRRTVMVDDTFKQYFTEEQLTQLAQRREVIGEERIRQAEAGWGELIPKVDAAIAEGMDPASPQAQRLAAQWMDLLEGFHGGDEGLRDSLYRMQAGEADRIESEFCGPSPAQIEFIAAANAARG
ncbi:MerR family transcriptional regulator [Nocardia puris]|uniref:DNA-binding transcriptional MerR regulator n=1 Tax=Nocardia puris TaxID=208602 RepID=A0A366DB86_9NOCA|nr:MerR family transcriptional regulator [Nocardia puris]RBO87317.1 DNA-binding transcriptional MerR regulator [Nocardia puris]